MKISFDEVRRNKRRSWFLVFVFMILIGMLGAVVGLFYFRNIYVGMVIAMVIGVIYTMIVFNSGGDMIMTLTGAKPVTKKELPYLYHTIEGLAIAANVPVPKAYVIQDSAMNAFATGKDPEHAAIAVTTGLLNTMDRQELEGVIAHEMSHIKNYDIRFMMLAAVLVGLVTLLSDFLLRSFLWGGHGGNRDSDNNSFTIILIVVGLVFAILAPFIGYMIKMAISRKREYMADASAATLTRYPPGLASALKKISNDPDPLVDKANKATAHLFISTPFRKKKSWLTGLFSTHPPINDRIKRLEDM